MKITGKVLIEKFNTETEEITSMVEFNDICYVNTQLFLTGRSGSGIGMAGVTPVSGQDTSYMWNIKTSSVKQKQSKLNHSIKTETTSYANVGYPTWTPKAGVGTKDYLTVVAILNAPPVSTIRTINCIALDYNNPSSFKAGTGAVGNGTLTNLTLTTPCSQTDTEILSITYRLYFDDYSTEPLSNTSQGMYEAIKYFFKQSTQYNLSSVPFFRFNDDRISAGVYNPTNCDTYSHQGIINTVTYITQYFSQLNVNTENTKTQYIGAIYNTYTFNSSDANVIGTFVNNFNIHSTLDETKAHSLAYQNVLRVEQSPVQNIFKHKSACNVPFQTTLPSEMSTMTGSINIDYSNWVDELLPSNYRIKIIDSGDVGVATYKIEKLKLTAGFTGNTFNPKTAILPQDPYDDESFHYHIKAANEKTLNQYGMNGGIVYRKLDEMSKLFACPTDRLSDFFAVYDVITGNKKVYDSSNITGFNLTNISDADIISSNIFISCANTGLWKIDLNLLTASHITVVGVDDSKCYAIATHSDGSIWALFEGGLGKSTDLGNTWTIYNPSSVPVLSKVGLTDDWANCVQMTLDPEHVEYQFLFNLKTASTNNKWIWWSTTTSATSPTTSISLGMVSNYEITDSFKCYNGRFYINAELNGNDNGPSTGLGLLYSIPFNSVNLTVNQIQVGFGNTTGRNRGLNILPMAIAGTNGILIQKRTFAGNLVEQSAFFVADSNIPLVATTFNLNSPSIEFFVRYGASPFDADLRSYSNNTVSTGASSQHCAYFESSNLLTTVEHVDYTGIRICLGCKPIVLEPNNPNYNTYKSAFWKEYGWDGSDWIEGHIGTRITHGTLETFLDGLQVSFTNGVTSPNFIATDFFNFIVGNGIMKDNATTLTFGIPYYPRRTQQISTFSSINVPIVSPVALLDEPVGFSTVSPNSTNQIHSYIQHKGTLNIISTNLTLYSDQLIPSSTSFTFRCKFTSLYSISAKEIGMAIFSSGTTYNKSLYFRVETNGDVTVRNSSNGTVATVLSNTISIDTEFKIERNGANLISVSYDSNVVYTTTINSQYVIYAKSDANNESHGFYDMYLSYTENRPFVRIGNSGMLTGSYNSLFAGTTVPTLVPDEYIELDNIPQVTVHKTAGEVQNIGEVKVATGSGWLIFNSSDTGKSIEGSFTAHYLY